MSRPVVLEISGADSIAAAVRYFEEHPEARFAIPTYATTGTEFGDFGGIEGNVAYLERELRERFEVTLEPLERLGDPGLWRALNGRFSSAIADLFGAFTPCAGCHLYLHLTRIPLAKGSGSRVVVSGERERHDQRVKPNQQPEALEAYERVLGAVGVQLAYPIRRMVHGSEVQALLGERWSGGSPQLECVLSGNYAGLDGSGCVLSLPDAFFERFLVPAGERLAAAIPASTADYEAIVADTLREAREAIS